MTISAPFPVPAATGADRPSDTGRVAGADYAVLPWDQLTEGDLTALVELERRAGGRTAPGAGQPCRPAEFIRSLPGAEQLSAVATVSGVPVGFLVASRRPAGVRVDRFAVGPERDEKVAAGLLAHLLSRADGVVSATCDLRDRWLTDLYRRAGFQVVSTSPDGGASLETTRLPPVSEMKVWYVFNTTGMRSGHAAHLPGLIGEMSRRCRTRGIGYGDPAQLPSFRRPLRWLRSFLRLLGAARRERTDVMFVRIHWKLAALLALAGRLGGGWRVAFWYSTGPGYLPGTRQSVMARLTRRVHAFVLRHVIDAVVTGPPSLVEDFTHRYRLPREKLILACNDVDADAWYAKAGREPDLAVAEATRLWLGARYRLLYTHGLDRLRGADRLPDLLDGLRRELGDAQILVLGHGALREPLARAGLLVAGPVANDAVAWAMGRAHCLIVPSRQEGFPRVMVEAMSLGLPCVAFDVGGCADVMGDLRDRYIAPDGDVSGLIRLAATATRQRAEVGPRLELIRRAAAFDTQPVAANLLVALRALRAQGPAEASWLAGALWRSVFPSRHAPRSGESG